MCRNGDIYITRLDMQPEGSLQAGIRPVIVISNDMANKFSPVVTVIPVTSKVKKKKLPTHVHLNDCGLDGPCTAMAEQITSIDKDRLGKWIGSIKNTVCPRMTQSVYFTRWRLWSGLRTWYLTVRVRTEATHFMIWRTF